MSLLGDRTVVAIDASGLTGGAFPGRFHSGKVLVERVSLEPGALLPSPAEPNLARPAAVKAALDALLERLSRPARITLVLPLGLARFALLRPPEGAEAREYARFRLAQSLPFPAADAIVDVVGVGGDLVLAAAVRRAVVSAYEELLASGPGLERVDLMPLAALAVRRQGHTAPAVDVFLGDTAFAVALYEEGVLRAFHTRWRAKGPADVDRIARVAASTAGTHGGAVTPRVHVLGEGSAEVVAKLVGGGLAASPGPEMGLLGAAA